MPGSTTIQRKTAQLAVLVRPTQLGRIKAWATRARVADAVLVRDALFGKGWAAVERQLVAEHGELTEDELHRGIHDALPKAERAAYAAEHGIIKAE